MPSNYESPPYSSDKGYGVKTAHRNLVVITTGVDILDSDHAAIGYIRELNYDTSRNVIRQRHLNYDDAGRIVELTAGPEDYTARATGVALYGANLMGRLARNSTDAGGNVNPILFYELHNNFVYFDLYARQIHPVTGAVIKLYFRDCLFSSFSSPMSIDGQEIVQSADIVVSHVESTVETGKRELQSGATPVTE